MIDKYKQAFQEEAQELLGELEAALLELGQVPEDIEVVGRAFRALHTIKGSGAMFGFDEIAGFAHNLESAFDLLRSGQLQATSDLINLSLAAGDQVRAMLDEAAGRGVADKSRTAEIVTELHRLTGSAETQPAVGPPLPAAPPAAPGGPARTWRIVFRPGPLVLVNGTNPLLLLRELRGLGTLRIDLDTSAIPPLRDMDPAHCYLGWEMTLTTAADAEAIRDVFIFVEDDCELAIEPVLDQRAPAVGLDSEKTAIGQPVPEHPATQHCSGTPTETPPGSTLEEPKREPPEPASDKMRKALVKESTVRVPSARLDHLVNLVGELVMNQSRIAQAARHAGAPELANPVQELERLVAELRDDVLGIRMLPIGTIFGRFRRLIHDLSSELAKEVDLITEGAETELDKSILDQLGEPLVHLLRNSIDHGIEPGEQRIRQGKPRRGTIRLSAMHTGSDVEIRIEDDGRGIDRAAVRAKAVERQLIAPDANLSDKELFNLLLLPGFSTARQVTSVSGRGVGLDVVKKQIDSLRGSLSIASEPGRGSRFSLTLPLTLAIIEGLLVQLGTDPFIIPMAAITENVDLHRDQRLRNNGRNLIAVRGELIPYIDLREAFGVEGEAPAIEKVVLARHEDTRVGIVVDRVLGTHQTVIQCLGRFFRNINVVSGTTILGDGRVALILDVSAVVRFADCEARSAPQTSRGGHPLNENR
jgi:two-component system chemotaxis sensor kinase CheA